MLKQVLEAVAGMLEDADKAKDQVEAKVYVKCAKTLLDKAIAGMTNEPPTTTAREVQPTHRPAQDVSSNGDKGPKPPFGAAADPKLYEVEAENGVLLKIKNSKGIEVGPDFELAVNGMAMEYKDAKGKPFQNIEFL